MRRSTDTAFSMTRAQVLATLTPHVRLMRETKTGDALADLLNLAYPDNPPFPALGFGDDLTTIRSNVESILDGWTRVGRMSEDHRRSLINIVRAMAGPSAGDLARMAAA